MKKMIFIIPIIFLLTGCYNYREINELAIVSGVSIRKVDDEIELTTEVINPKKEQDASSGEEPEFIIYTSRAKSVQEAIRKMIKESPRKMYGAHIEILVIDEGIAYEKSTLINAKLRKHLDDVDILDFFARDPEIRSEFKVLVGKSDDILKITTPLEKISSENIRNSLENNNKYLGFANVVTYHELISNVLNPNIELVLPVLSMKGNVNLGEDKENISNTSVKATSIIDGMAIFRNNKLIGYLTEEESLTYNILRDSVKNFFIRTSGHDNEYIVHEIIRLSSKMEFDKNKNEMKITLTGKSAISEVNEKIDLENLEEVSKLEKELNQELKKMVERSILSIQKKYNSDIFGFGDVIYKSYPKYFQKIKDEFKQDGFQNMKVNVSVKIKGQEKGNLNRGVVK